MYRISLVLSALLLGSYLSAQEISLRFTHLTTQEGLPHSIVWDIHQDDLGYMWFGTNNGLARYDGYNFRIYQPDPDDPASISNKSVNAVYPGTGNDLWLVLLGIGLNRFDRATEHVERYFPDEDDCQTLSSSMVNDVLKDTSGTIWFATNKGLDRFCPEKKNFIRVISSRHEGRDLQSFIKLHPDRRGNVWFATQKDIGFYRLNDDSVKWLSDMINLPAASQEWTITSFDFDLRGNLWFATQEDGLHCCRLQEKTIHTFPASMFSGLIETVYFDNHGTGYAVTAGVQNTLFIFRPDPDPEITFIPYSLQYEGQYVAVMDIQESRMGDVFIATNIGLLQYNPSQNRFIHVKPEEGSSTSLSGPRCLSVLVDQMDNLWVSCEKAGVNFADLSQKKFITWGHNPFSPLKSVPENFISTVFKDCRQRLWVGSVSKGLACIDRTRESYRFFPAEQFNHWQSPLCMFEDQAHDLWVGFNRGQLARIRLADLSVQLFDTLHPGSTYFKGADIRKIVEDEQGNLWMVSNPYGLVEYDRGKQEFIHHPLDFDQPDVRISFLRTLYFDSSGLLWIGTHGSGLLCFNRKTGRTSRYTHDPDDIHSLSDNTVYAIYEDREGNLWIGTAGGLNCFYKDKVLRKFFRKDGLPSNSVMGIVPDGEGNLWLSTESGLSQFDTESEKFSNYSVDDGLPSDEFSMGAYFAAPDGEILFGTLQGMVTFMPQSIKPNIYGANPTLTGLRVQNEPVKPGKPVRGHVILTKDISFIREVKFTHKDYIFSIEFSALHFAAPNKVLYEYYLEGYETDWIKTTADRRFATYSNLPPGNYVFRIRATNSDGILCNPEHQATLLIHILPPFWKTWWFRALMATTIVLLTLLVYYIRVRSLHRQKRILEETVKQRTTELMEINLNLEEKQEEVQKQKEELVMQKEHLVQMNEQLRQRDEEVISQNEELSLHRNNLEKLVEERTRELEAARLKAEESDNLKSAFLANMSHEIRTPLNAIVGFSYLLADSSVSEYDKTEYTRIIRENSDALLVLINDILDISKIQARQLVLNYKPVRLHSLCREVLESFSVMAQEKRIELSLQVPKDLKGLTTETDSVRLRQILNNLLSNSLKFTSTGSVTIGYQVDADSMIHFFVKDTGIGIDETYGELIFERFIKIEKDSDQMIRGTGLGLSICRHLVKLMGGSIWYDSVLNEGTTFHFKLPLKLAEAPKEDADGNGKQVTDLRLHGKTILVAEDNTDNYHILEALIRKSGAELLWVRNGLEAVHSVKQRKDIDLVLMDLKMPVLSGYQATEKIKILRPELPVIAQTAFANARERDEYRQFGFDGYLVKPFARQELFALLNKLLI